MRCLVVARLGPWPNFSGEAMPLLCPYCDSDVIEGAEHCDACGQSLSENYLPPPATTVERALLTDRVRMFQGRHPMTVAPSTTLRDVIHLLVENKVGCVLVTQGHKLLGIFTERDALLKVGERAADLAQR